MQQVFVTYAPDTPDARRIAEEVKAAFEGHEAVVALKPAAQASILDIAPVLGAHTGPGLVGICAAPLNAFDGIPDLA